MKEYEDGLTVCPHCGYAQGTPAREAYHLPPETILNGRYLVGRVLGFGGFGTTYIAWDLVLEKKVAIKEYMPSDFATRAPGETQLSVYDGELGEQFEAGLKSFIDESRRLAKFNHEDGIVHIFDSFLENGTAYIVMEYLEGKTLKELLKERGGKIPYDEAVKYILPVLKSLDAVHQTGIIHRDIAPDNIFLTNDGKVKLIDFGASRYATTLHSKSLSVILKQGYAPEEQYRSHGEQGPWSDVYAVCATLYRAITGVVPEDALERCANDKLVPPSKMGINLPVGIENAILNGLNTKAENRIQSAKELAQALSGEIEVQRIKEEKKKEDVGKWSKKQIIIASCSGVAVIAVVILAILGVFSLNKSLDTTLYATVPDYIGMTLEEAQTQWDEYCAEQDIENVSLSVASGVTSDQIEGYHVNQIYAINPKAGAWFKKVSEKEKFIYVTIVLPSVQDMINENLGKDSWVMQNLENYSQVDAQRILESMVGVNFTFETIASEKSAGTVVRTEPAAGTQINKGDTIIVYISDGSQMNMVETVDEDKPIGNQNFNDEKEIENNADPYPNQGDVTTQPTTASQYTLTIETDEGILTVSGAGSYASGATVTVKATMKNGYRFSGWTSNYPDLVPDNQDLSYTFKMPSCNVVLTVGSLKIIASGFCGENLKWSLDALGIFNITGYGEMYDYNDNMDETSSPCYNWGGIIKQINISEGVTHIGDYAFFLLGVDSIVIPKSVKSIGKGAFFESSIKEIVIPSGVTLISDHTFEYCRNLKKVVIPNTITEIGREAFSGCENLSEINFPSQLRDIGVLAFYDCNNLSNITIPNNTKSIGDMAFGNCFKLSQLTIPYSVTYLGRYVFNGWTTDQTIYIQGRNVAASSWDTAWKQECFANIIWNA